MDASRNSHYYPYSQQPPQQPTQAAPPNLSTNTANKEIYQYDAPWATYALDWCKSSLEKKSFRLAIGSFIEDSNNKLQIIARTDLLDHNVPPFIDHQRNTNDFTVIAEADSYYPITKVLWEPRKIDPRSSYDLLATTGDILRIWEIIDDPRYGQNLSHSIHQNSSQILMQQQLVKKAELVNMKQSDFCAPLTSFDWNETDPSLIVTSSIDTTCTVWNIETNQAKTQLIAHDSDVYDVAFMHGSADTFASVGADGSVRLFDLRSLEHSTILYEAPPSSNMNTGPAATSNNGTTAAATVPLLRLQFNRMNSNYLATFHMDSSAVQILDIRYPSAPIAELSKSHSGSINCLCWSPTDANQIATGGDDSQVLVWNINNNGNQPTMTTTTAPRSVTDPILAYVADAEVNAVTWSKSTPEWIGIGFGKTIQALRV